jgi:hypothetical protein
MNKRIEISYKNDIPGGDELIADFQKEIEELEIGSVNQVVEIPKGPVLVVPAYEIIKLIVDVALLSVEILLAIIEIGREVRARYADRKKMSISEVPPIILSIQSPKTKIINIYIGEKKISKKRLQNIISQIEG